MEEALTSPEFIVSDFAKEARMSQLHIGFQALGKFFEKHQSLPTPHDEQHAKEVITYAQEINSSLEKSLVESIDEKLLTLLSYGAQGEIAPMVSSLILY